MIQDPPREPLSTRFGPSCTCYADVGEVHADDCAWWKDKLARDAALKADSRTEWLSRWVQFQ